MDKLILAILMLSGASGIEELSESEVERYYFLSRNPIQINLCPASKIEESGLLSPYQCASLLDYIGRNGDIASLKELSSIDGFNEKLASALEPFISFESRVSPGNISRGHRINNEFIAKTTLKYSSSALNDRYAFKYRISDRNRWTLAASYRDELSFSMSWYGTKHLKKLIIGDYNSRYAQGLTSWSGFELKNPSSASSFEKKGGGISGVWTWSPQSVNRGAALTLGFGSMSVDLAAAIGGGILGNVMYRWRKAEAGTVLHCGPESSASLYGRVMAGSVKLWGELAYGINLRSIKAVVGAGSKDGAGECWSLMGSVNPMRFCAALTKGGLDCLAWAGEKDMRATARYLWAPVEKFSLTPKLCYRHTWGDSGRIEARIDLNYHNALFSSDLRADYVRKKAGSYHISIEPGLKDEKWICNLRFGLFDVREWEDRIYVYERDIPGSFSVPAYYGRGVTFSLVAAYKTRRSRFGLRLSNFIYRDKADKTEFKFQYSLDL